jgi:hypothetical protein
LLLDICYFERNKGGNDRNYHISEDSTSTITCNILEEEPSQTGLSFPNYTSDEIYLIRTSGGDDFPCGSTSIPCKSVSYVIVSSGLYTYEVKVSLLVKLGSYTESVLMISYGSKSIIGKSKENAFITYSPSSNIFFSLFSVGYNADVSVVNFTILHSSFLISSEGYSVFLNYGTLFVNDCEIVPESSQLKSLFYKPVFILMDSSNTYLENVFVHSFNLQESSLIEANNTKSVMITRCIFENIVKEAGPGSVILVWLVSDGIFSIDSTTFTNCLSYDYGGCGYIYIDDNFIDSVSLIGSSKDFSLAMLSLLIRGVHLVKM